MRDKAEAGADSQSCILIFGAVSQWICRASSALSSVGDRYNYIHAFEHNYCRFRGEATVI